MFQQLSPLLLHVPDNLDQNEPECQVSSPERQLRAAESGPGDLSNKPETDAGYGQAKPSCDVSAG